MPPLSVVHLRTIRCYIQHRHYTIATATAHCHTPVALHSSQLDVDTTTKLQSVPLVPLCVRSLHSSLLLSWVLSPHVHSGHLAYRGDREEVQICRGRGAGQLLLSTVCIWRSICAAVAHWSHLHICIALSRAMCAVQLLRGLDGCSFVDEVVMSDVYYDSSAHSLSMIDHWLRSRDNTWSIPLIDNHPLAHHPSIVHRSSHVPLLLLPAVIDAGNSSDRRSTDTLQAHTTRRTKN